MAHLSLKAKFVAVVAPLALLFVLAMAVWGEAHSYFRTIERLKAKLDHIVANQTIVLSRAIATEDERLVALTAAAMIADLDVVLVEIHDGNGKEIISLGAPPETGMTAQRSIRYFAEDRLQEGGTLRIGVTTQPARYELTNGLWASGLAATGAVLSIWLAGFVAFRKVIGEPLSQLHDAIQRWRSDAPFTLPDNPAQDELGDLTRAFALLQSEISSRESELRAVRGDLERRVAERTSQLAHQATHDSLTELPNRAHLTEFLDRALERAQHRGTRIGVLHIDLDFFKRINDTLGHGAGDTVLRNAATRMRASLRKGDFVARVGGDEFVLVASTNGDRTELEGLARRIISRISEPIVCDGVECSIGASIGIAVSGEDSASDQLIIDADIALYAAKKAGRGVYRLFNRAMGESYRERQRILTDLTVAIGARSLEPYFQPQMSLDGNRIIGFEMLARWHHPTDGMLNPARFIEFAEEAGLTTQVDDIIMEHGLDALPALRACAGSDIRLSLNASNSSLCDPGFVDRLKFALEARNLTPADLAVEIVEDTLLTGDDNRAMRSVDRLVEAGFIVELDDFGTGYTALSTLASLRFHAIKLDRSLIMGLPEPSSEAIVRAMLALSRELGLTVIAEGIETAEQLDMLRTLGCAIVQGYGIGRPMPLDVALTWLEEREAQGAAPASVA